MGAMPQHDAVPVNGSDRILISAAPQRRVMPNGWLGNPANTSLPILTGASSWMAQHDAVPLNGSNRILISGAP